MNSSYALEQGVGAAVVSTLGRQASRIGSPATHTVYAAELRGIEMALSQIYMYKDERNHPANSLSWITVAAESLSG